jgi:hypothetical protein
MRKELPKANPPPAIAIGFDTVRKMQSCLAEARRAKFGVSFVFQGYKAKGVAGTRRLIARSCSIYARNLPARVVWQGRTNHQLLSHM